MISTKLQSNFIEITSRLGYSPVNLLRIFRTPFYKTEHLFTVENEKYEKSLTTKIKFLSFIFWKWKMIYFARLLKNIVYENVLNTITFLVKVGGNVLF